jgi:hypothetical protein
VTDPFGATATDMADPFDNATTDFINPEDLLGRIVLVIPTGKGTAKGDNGDPYDYVLGDMLICSGETNRKIEGPIPYEVTGQRFSAAMMVTQLLKNLPTGRMLAGKVDGRPGKFNRTAFSFGTLSDEEVAKARPIATAWLERRAKATDPFGS